MVGYEEEYLALSILISFSSTDAISYDWLQFYTNVV